MFKSKIESDIREQFEDKSITIKTAVEQTLIWPDYTEIRAFCDDGRVFSCMVCEGNQVNSYVEVPKETK